MHFAGNPFSGKIPVHTTVPRDRGAFKVLRNSEKSCSFSSHFPTHHAQRQHWVSLDTWHYSLFPGLEHTPLGAERPEWENGLLIQICSLALSCYMHMHTAVCSRYSEIPRATAAVVKKLGLVVPLQPRSEKVIQVSCHIMWRKLTAPGACMKSRLQFG